MKKWNRLLVCTAVLVMSLGSAPMALAAEGSVAKVNIEELPESPVKENNEIIDQAATSGEGVEATNASVEPEASSSQTSSSETAESTPASSETVETSTEPAKEVKTVESTEASDEADSAEDEDYFFDAWAYNRGRSDLYDAGEASAAAPRARIAASPTGIQAIYPDKNKNTPKMDFIDVSSHNGSISVAQYQSMKKYGVKAVVVKLTEATSYRNPLAKSQIKNAQAAGLIVHAYHYSWFTSTASAKAEAAYFVNYAKELGLPKTAYMINDMEEPKIMGDGNHTNDSLEFVKEIKRLGYSNTKHYIGQWWITGGTINATKLGQKNCWVAAYPLKPNSSMRNNSAYDSWQWTSRVYMPGISFPFDMSVDYTGDLTTKSGVGSPGKAIAVNDYFTVTSFAPIYQNFNWKTTSDTNTIMGKTYRIKYKYNHSNGNTYYSIYDNKDKWMGYIESDCGKNGVKSQGSHNSYKKYAKIKNDNLFKNFDTMQKVPNNAILNQELLIKGYYNHFNGNRYYSLYHKNGKTWYGYLNSTDTTIQPDQGQAVASNKYVTITQKGHSLWSSFAFSKSPMTDDYINRTYRVKEVYQHLNGYTYYGIYDQQEKRLGYLYSVAGQLVDHPGGVKQTVNLKVSTGNTNYNSYQDFNFKVKYSAAQLRNKVFNVKEKYSHYNGKTYYSLVNSAGVWHGYIEQAGVKPVEAQGPAIKEHQYVSFTQKCQKIYSDFNFNVKTTTDQVLNQTFEIREKYQHENKKTYYGVFDHKGNRFGYIEAGTGTLTDNSGGVWHRENFYIKITKSYNSYSKFNGFVVKHQATYLKNKVYKVTGSYNAQNGSTYYSLYDAKGKWQGYINENAGNKVNAQGSYVTYGKYFTPTNRTGKLYTNFNFKVRGSLANFTKTTLAAKGCYNHFNGKRYLSLYDKNGKWVGYTEETNGKVSASRGGSWQKENIRVKISSKYYTIYSNFSFKQKNHSSKFYQQTLKVTGKYYHFNGATYYSLYNNQGKWIGYINATGTKKI